MKLYSNIKKRRKKELETLFEITCSRAQNHVNKCFNGSESSILLLFINLCSFHFIARVFFQFNLNFLRTDLKRAKRPEAEMNNYILFVLLLIY